MADQNRQDSNPVTLADLAREGRLLWCYCRSCSYERGVDPLLLGLDPTEAVPTVGKRLKCSRCGSREIETKPHLHVEPLEVMRVKSDGSPASAATINTSVAAVKALLGFAHTVGYTRFNAAPLIKLKKAPRTLAQRLMSDVEVALLIRAAKPGRDRLMLQVAYYGGLRVSELAGLTWRQVLPRKTGEVQLAVVGKGDKPRHVLLPAHLAELLQTMRAGQKPSARVFPLTERRINYIVKAAAKRAGINSAISAHWLRHAHASHAIDAGAPITLVSQTLGHADLKTTSVYAHAKPNDCSSRYLKRTMR